MVAVPTRRDTELGLQAALAIEPHYSIVVRLFFICARVLISPTSPLSVHGEGALWTYIKP